MSTEPVRVWPLSDIGGPEWTAAQVDALTTERVERIAELKRAIRRRDTAARKVVRLTAACMELADRIAAARFEAGR